MSEFSEGHYREREREITVDRVCSEGETERGRERG